MSRIVSLLNGMTGRITTRLVIVVSVSILITAALGYFKLSQVTETNSSIRIDRAARAAAALFTERLSSEFSTIRDPVGRPLAIRLKGDTADMSLSFRDVHDPLLKEIGLINQGAANLFRLNPETRAFDRFATTFRKPDGSIPPPMSIGSDHPAYSDIINNQPHLGEVPVMGRLRLAYLTPIQTANGMIAGALAVDVGWVDDLVMARNELRTQIIVAAILILVLVAAFGVMNMSTELKPLRQLAKYADDLAAEAPAVAVPFRSRQDEIGALAQGLERVVALQSKLAHLAYTDELTGLGNRSRYLIDLERSLRKSLSGNQKSTLMHLDLDNFKQINDAYGQETGDALLKAVAAQIVNTVGETSKIARLASDQFTVLISDKSSVVQTAELAEKLVSALRQPFQLAAGEVRLAASIGIVLLQHDAEDADEAHRNAGRLAGVEALARWTHPAEGPISPGKFIPIAESSGQIVGLGTLVLDLACEQAAKWRDEKFDFKHISVNVSPIQLWQPDFIDVLKAALERHKVSGRHIYIEITESVFVDHSESRIAKVLAGIRALGVKLSLDDFGSGYSSLGYLNRLPFDQLKVDRSFITDIDTDQRKQQVLQGVLGLGRGLGFNIVVEGAETLEEVTVVEQMGCDAIQGFYYARPAPALLIPEMISKIAHSKASLKMRSA